MHSIAAWAVTRCLPSVGLVPKATYNFRWFVNLLPSCLLCRADAMSSRVPKRKDTQNVSPSSQTLNRQDRAVAIDQFGFLVMPCSRCSFRGVQCKMMEGAKKCGLCTRLGRPCDVSGVPLHCRRFNHLCECACFLILFLVSRVTEEDKRLEVEEAAAESHFLARREALRRAQREFDASLDALESLRRKRRVLKSQGEAMIHSVSDPSEESAEVGREASEATFDLQSLVHSDVDWSAIGVDWASLRLGDDFADVDLPVPPTGEVVGESSSANVEH